MPNLSRSRIALFVIDPPWAKLSVAFAVLSGITATATSIPNGLLVVLFSIVLLFVVLIGSRLIEHPSITCLQTTPDHNLSVEDQHLRRYYMYKGFARIDIYVDIPSWQSSFDILLRPSGPFALTDFNLPAAVTLTSQNHLTCEADMGGFPFTLKITGDAADLSRAEYTLHFIDQNSDEKIHSISLVTDPDLPPGVEEDELGPDEAEEWGLSPASEVGI